MAVLPILTWPDPCLSQTAAPVHGEDPGALVADMFETMYVARGRGLAAPQVGVMKRVFVMDCGWKEGEETPLAMINPTIIAAEREPVDMEEGCLSLPGLMVPVTRPVAVTVQWTDETGQIHMNDFDGFEARCIQHELDHLNGVVTLDRVAPDLRATLETAYVGQAG